MSHVTDIILITGLEDEGIEGVIKYLFGQYNSTLIEVGCKSGGNKAMQCEVWAGAFNHMDIEGFVDVVLFAKWEEPEEVQLMVKDEHDEHFDVRVQEIDPEVTKYYKNEGY